MARKKTSKRDRILTMEGWNRRNKPFLPQTTPQKKKPAKKKK